MIGYLAGKILEHTDGRCVVLTGSADPEFAIGYSVSIPAQGVYATFHAGMPVRLFIHTHVREDALDLYGFASREEKELFNTLLTVNEIGPKGALGILTKVEPSTLIQAILGDDKASLTSIPGIGKKTAERVILELADPIQKKMDQGLLPREWITGAPATAKSGKKTGSGVMHFSKVFVEAKEALLGLGYREQEIAAALKKVADAAAAQDSSVNEAPTPMKPEAIIKLALQQLM